MTTNRDLVLRPLKTTDWKHIEALFGEAGACGGCWCMYWRVPSTGKYWEQHKGASNRRSFKALVDSGRASGVLALEGRTPVAWCSVAPRRDFAYLARARKLPPPPDNEVWSVTCFFIKAGHRRCGVAGRLLAAAVDFARSRGASSLEGYPSVPKAANAQIPDAFAHTGVPKLFRAEGFKLAARAGARNVYRLAL